MVCIYCGGPTQVTNSRPQKRLNRVWRRRSCQECGAVFSSHEAAAYDDAWRVEQEDGNLVPFSRDKLFISLQKACEHRPQSIDDAASLTATVIAQLPHHAQNGLIEAVSIVLIAHEVLSRFDTAAAVRYAAFHPVD